MNRIPSLQQLDRARMNSPWDLGNKVLYDMCRKNFGHESDEKILAKVWLIGRAYSAAIERRKNKDKKKTNDNFYVRTVASTFRKSKLDDRMNKLKRYRTITVENLPLIVSTHHYLTKLISKKSFTALNKRSFSSKYLHFHFPHLFFLYDTRAVKALRAYQPGRVPVYLRDIAELNKADKEYAKFFCKCYDLKERIRRQYGIRLTNRQFDNALISFANKQQYLRSK